MIGSFMRTYFFDVKDGVPSRHRGGLQFPTVEAAIDHSVEMARQLRGDPRANDPGLYISVVDESGAEVHREHVYKVADRRKKVLPSRG
jgi:hypothetical protein